jgi:hypothetical protein
MVAWEGTLGNMLGVPYLDFDDSCLHNCLPENLKKLLISAFSYSFGVVKMNFLEV